MMMKRTYFVGLAAVLAWPVQAQVMEIGSGGQVSTYDGPTVFTDRGATSLIDEKRGPSGSLPDTLFADAAERHGIDVGLLRAVAWQESRGSSRAVSVKGALGVMQLMPTTAAELGVDPTSLADSIRGGAMYLRRQLDRFGDVQLALAAYNAGPGAVIRYRGVPPFRETQDYVTKIMARWHPPAAPFRTSSAVIEVPQP